MNIVPQHPQTTNALKQARRLADWYCPTNEPQRAAHRRIVDAISSGDLYQVVDAIRAARTVGRRGLATLDWREWSGSWLDKVQRIILDEVEQERAA